MLSGRLDTRQMTLCALFTALIAVGAQIKVPLPVVPFTLQFLFTTLAGLLLGGRLGALSVAVYLILGLAGAPVFTEGGGPAYLLKPSFGYLIGFMLGAWSTGIIASRTRPLSLKRAAAASACGLAVVYICGMAYCYLISNFVLAQPLSFEALFIYCFLLAVPGDILLCFVEALLAVRLAERSPLSYVRS
ncbi:biotin transporter BioY [Cloacibacillus porcorum]